jgi:hypothetical protein
MSTQAQITANQANAQHSTGPRTETGKQASSQNNLRHGFAGKFKVLDWEDQSEFDLLLATFGAKHEPADPYEFVLVEKMAQHFWLSQRSLKLQEQCFRPDLAMKEADTKLALYMRYQTTHDRAFRQASDELRKLRNEKRQAEIGFESQKHQEEQKEREIAVEIRRQEKHEAQVRLAHAKAMHLEIDSDIRQTIEAPLPGNMRMPFDTLKKVFSSAVAQVNRELKAAEAA